MVCFKTMTSSEFDKFRIISSENYARDKMRANSLSEEEARKVAEADFQRILPDGLNTKDNYLNVILNDSSEAIGHFWYFIKEASTIKRAFVYDIFISEEHRGQGYGKAVMELFEKKVKEHDVKLTALHVFGYNEPAIGLYKALGYQVTDLMMEKKLEL